MLTTYKIDTKESLRDFLITLTKRPGAFVGTARLDYIMKFSSGCGVATPEYPWAFDHEVQEWIFLKDSVAIANAASLNAESLLYRCYGNGIEAIDMYRTILGEVEFGIRDIYSGKAVSQIYAIKNHFKHIHDGFGADNFPSGISDEQKQAATELAGDLQPSYENIIPIIGRMIKDPYDDLLVHIYNEKYFQTVRFLFRTNDGEWKSNIALLSRENYYQNLLTLHAYVSFTLKKEHTNHIITLRHENGSITADYKEVHHEVPDDYGNFHKMRPLREMYEEWEASVLS